MSVITIRTAKRDSLPRRSGSRSAIPGVISQAGGEHAMEFFAMLRQMGLAALFSIIISFLPLIAAGAYLFRPSEQRLAMMRPLSLAGIFAGLNGSSLGAINTLRGL